MLSTEIGVTMGTGQNVQLIVVEETRPDPGPAPTLLLLTVEQIVREMPNRSDLVTLTLALVKSLCFLISLHLFQRLYSLIMMSLLNAKRSNNMT